MKYLFYLLLFFPASIIAQQEFTLTVDIDNIQSDKGKIAIAIFENKDSYMKDGQEVASTLVEIKNKKCRASFLLQEGSYAITVFHDINNDLKLSTNWIGIPNEPYGFSNNPKATFGPPGFDKASFVLDQNKSISIVLN